MKISIKNPAPLGENLTKWGDYHFGLLLKRRLEQLGVDVVQHFYPEWDIEDGEDAVLVLRGKRRYKPDRKCFNLLWNISHPATLSPAECEDYDLVYVASERHRSMLCSKTSTPLRTLRQCTEPEVFKHPDLAITEDDRNRRSIVFVANSRFVRRDMIRWISDMGIKPVIIGRHWNKLGYGNLVQQDFIENSKIPELYMRSRLSLNDHWGDMRHFGIINNRIFDCLACGTPVLSDHFPELENVCGSSLLYAYDETSLLRSLEYFSFFYKDLLEQTRLTWEKISHDYTFEARARTIISDIENAGSLRDEKTTSSYASDMTCDGKVIDDTRAAIYKAKSSLKNRPLRVLHLNPTAEIGYILSGDADLDYTSAGQGNGPWHVNLESNIAALPEKSYDIVLSECHQENSAQMHCVVHDLSTNVTARSLKPSGFSFLI
ncbi:glycosyltransferase family protein [Pararhizobium mangrovi]|uniref:Glycosyltransferase family 1 protein n=1 Tax=Pararhizobium mangrovi TaxID=2590452 RepID=A0A506UBZ3_9HYPH|nr:glycosyltransferase [Pararhizobium mangrovi]TPW30641.1 glycosyltransferase family 1 protein [Pararhizobium mangrovi]